MKSRKILRFGGLTATLALWYYRSQVTTIMILRKGVREVNRKLVSSEAAERLGVSRKHLMTILARHPELRPAERLPDDQFLWTEEEIEAVAKSRRGPGRPPKTA